MTDEEAWGRHAGDTSIVLQVPFTPRSATVARHRLRAWMQLIGAPADRAEDALLTATELLTNALAHARPVHGGNLLVQADVEGAVLHLAVSDGGSHEVPRRLDLTALATSGRGLALVEALTQKWWSETSTAGRTVHALVPLTTP